MKKILLPLIVVLFSFTMFAQNEGYQDAVMNRRPDLNPELREVLHRKPLLPELLNRSNMLKAAGHLNVLDSQVYEVYEPVSDRWNEDWKAFYVFNDDGLLTEYREEEWNSDEGRWEVIDRETNQYDEQGHLILYTDYDLDESGSSWYDNYTQLYTYDDGRLSEMIESQKDNPDESYYPVWRTVYYYNEDNQVANTREYINTIGWEETWRTEYIYDDAGRLVTFYDYDDNEDLPSGWENAWREEYTYDTEGHLASYEESEWDADFNQWFPTDREEYHILSNGDVESYTDFDWDEAGEEWLPNWKGEYTYNTDIPYEELALPWFFHDDFPNYFNHLMTNYTNYDYVGGDRVLDSRGNYYFTLSSSTGLSTNKKEGLALYPNPASATLYLPAGDDQDIRRVEAYDLTGKRVLSKSVAQQRIIQVDQLNKGIYFFRLLDGNDQTISSQKIVLQR